tara:strand:- start:71 stop:1138 length:1068 start_codon:yes stop_codon:yes gene_type:complete
MVNEFALFKSRELANSVRYSEDKHDSSLGLQPLSLDNVTDEFYRSSVEINKNLTPNIEISFQNVCKRLSLDRTVIQAFVNNSHEVQAACYYVDANRCLVRISSALINLLGSIELEFVIGHELGHFLLQHAPNATSRETAEYFVFQRAKEISADRIGLIGCGSLHPAVTALVKTASGLNSDHIQVSLQHYLAQLDQIVTPASGESLFSTHPSMLIRTYAINEFAKNAEKIEFDFFGSHFVYESDKLIKHFFDKYVDKKIVENIEQSTRNLEIWLAAKIVSLAGRFNKDHQDKFKQKFGDEDLQKLRNFFQSCDPSVLSEEIEKKIEAANKRLVYLAPSRSENVIDNSKRLIEKLFI